MNYNERFGQIEAMLADLLRRMDRQAEQMDRQAEQMDRQAEQMDGVISILKISDERQTRAEERQDTILAEMQRGFAKSDRKFEEQNQRLIDQGKRQDVMLDTQAQMLEVLSRQATRTDALERHAPTIMAFEGRMRRLEEAVFNKAS
ncbi:MAG: hypothetical protein M3Y12_00270 [Bacteroidota bacterium]|nr:hypothetical protein [Bacteroidota bacterium]